MIYNDDGHLVILMYRRSSFFWSSAVQAIDNRSILAGQEEVEKYSSKIQFKNKAEKCSWKYSWEIQDGCSTVQAIDNRSILAGQEEVEKYSSKIQFKNKAEKCSWKYSWEIQDGCSTVQAIDNCSILAGQEWTNN